MEYPKLYFYRDLIKIVSSKSWVAFCTLFKIYLWLGDEGWFSRYFNTSSRVSILTKINVQYEYCQNRFSGWIRTYRHLLEAFFRVKGTLKQIFQMKTQNCIVQSLFFLYTIRYMREGEILTCGGTILIFLCCQLSSSVSLASLEVLGL